MRCAIFAFVFLLVACKEKPKPIEPYDEVVPSAIVLKSLESPTQGKSHLPRLKAVNDVLHMTWVEQEDSLAILKYAFYENEKWSTPATITSGTDWFVNWADFPSLAVNGETVLTNILEKSAEGTYDYDVKLHLFNRTENSTESTLSRKRKTNFLLNTDGIPAEHGFVSSAAYDGGFYVSWLDGRNTKNENPEENQMTLRNAFVSLDGEISQETEIDARVCDCCNTATAITLNGPIVVYRDRSDAKPEMRDMTIVRWVDGQWSTPQSIGNDNWQLTGCPVNGPAIDTQEEKVVVSWFTASNDNPRVMTAFSITNGEKFGAPIRIDSGNAIGRVDTQFLWDGSALVSWLEPKGENVVLQVARVYKDGHHEEPITITNTSSERQSGFPQLEVAGKTVFVAWTDLEDDASQVKMVSFKIN
ncbi:hypothetical protein EAX61_00800 [Dokdonia sinensis]|uniref:Exo-alpha-sialidase n=1 Tax=Dokdonia sinensis TaxID=2479847 RepID=A0A3M0GMK5_9FLAO|nr:hypothetical protein [Dokdonia sinensis]RMB63952.1 hypothetical protein EAX61_00800 [Dokdonia sinensis]